MMLFTPTSYEPEAVKAARSWFGETGRQVYAVGPLLPAASKATAQANEKKLSAEANEIITFLDKTLKTSGKKSLVYVSLCLRYDWRSLLMHRAIDLLWVRLLACAGT